MRSLPLTAAMLLGAAFSSALPAQAVRSSTRSSIANAGPYNVVVLAGGTGVERDLTRAEAAVAADAPWTLSAWVRPGATGVDDALLAIGDPLGACRCLSLANGLVIAADGAIQVSGGTALPAGRWTHVAAVADGH